MNMASSSHCHASNAGFCREISQAKYHPAHRGHQHHNIPVLHLAEKNYYHVWTAVQPLRTQENSILQYKHLLRTEASTHQRTLYIKLTCTAANKSHKSEQKKHKKNDQPIKHETVMDKFMAPRISLRSLVVRSDVCFLRCEGDV